LPRSTKRTRSREQCIQPSNPSKMGGENNKRRKMSGLWTGWAALVPRLAPKHRSGGGFRLFRVWAIPESLAWPFYQIGIIVVLESIHATTKPRFLAWRWRQVLNSIRAQVQIGLLSRLTVSWIRTTAQALYGTRVQCSQYRCLELPSLAESLIGSLAALHGGEWALGFKSISTSHQKASATRQQNTGTAHLHNLPKWPISSCIGFRFNPSDIPNKR